MNSEKNKRVIPVGYRIGGTSIACSSLLSAPIEHKSGVQNAVAKGVELVLKELEHPLMKPSKTNRYDVRVWGHIYALDMFCRLKGRTEYKHLLERNQRCDPEIGRWFSSRRGRNWRLELPEQTSALLLCDGASSAITVVGEASWF